MARTSGADVQIAGSGVTISGIASTGSRIVLTYSVDWQATPGPRTITITTQSGSTTSSVIVDPANIAIKLELVSTVISTDGKYSEDSTIRATAVNASTHAPVNAFTGTVNIAEDSTTQIYSQNGGCLVFSQNACIASSSITISSAGTVTFVAKSLADPKTEGRGGVKPDPASLKSINYPVDGGASLIIPQWIISGTRIDSHSNGDVFDWLQSRAKDLFAAATGDVSTVFGKISSYSIDNSLTDGYATTPEGGATSPIRINPFYKVLRLDSATNLICGFNTTNMFRTMFYHEGRHAYQSYLHTVAGNDGDGDYLVNNIPMAPADIIRDTITSRDVCSHVGGVVPRAYHGDSTPDSWGGPDWVIWALEMDAYKFVSLQN